MYSLNTSISWYLSNTTTAYLMARWQISIEKSCKGGCTALLACRDQSHGGWISMALSGLGSDGSTLKQPHNYKEMFTYFVQKAMIYVFVYVFQWSRLTTLQLFKNIYILLVKYPEYSKNRLRICAYPRYLWGLEGR